MPDIIDRAQEMSARYLTVALNAVPRANSGPSLERCRQCGEEIPIRRRQAVPGCELCIECQRELEGGA